jgi:hypothetical protein
MSSEIIDSTLPERLSCERVATGRQPDSKSDPLATPQPSEVMLEEESAFNAALEAEIDAEIAHLICLRLRKEAALLKKSQNEA